jgi:hypothetical protein
MVDQQKVEAAVRAKYPDAPVTGSGCWGVVLNSGRITVELFEHAAEAHRFAQGGLRVEYFGPPIRTLMRAPGEGIDE